MVVHIVLGKYKNWDAFGYEVSFYMHFYTYMIFC